MPPHESKVSQKAPFLPELPAEEQILPVLCDVCLISVLNRPGLKQLAVGDLIRTKRTSSISIFMDSQRGRDEKFANEIHISFHAAVLRLSPIVPEPLQGPQESVVPSRRPRVGQPIAEQWTLAVCTQ